MQTVTKRELNDYIDIRKNRLSGKKFYKRPKGVFYNNKIINSL